MKDRRTGRLTPHGAEDQDKESEYEDETLLAELREGLEKLDRSIPVFPPEIHWFQEQVLQHRKELKRKLLLDLLLFFTIAVIVLAGTAAVMLNTPSVYIYFQIFVSALAPVILWVTRRKRKVGA
ncbi:DUF5345 family protein [Paenibacillus sp. J2TS4]|uniref:DUF5345 family protein n=1 Tax=Paenibacillus sp. J2TS4 TaxID=2807194 RepID=UPI001B2383A5|nr:DUF5345 family protein [Paenibacillus sp. J2TS4]GIP35446.1 hypothetical protein J2TS4_46560 [Paenibacillus sp. J2TS4]